MNKRIASFIACAAASVSIALASDAAPKDSIADASQIRTGAERPAPTAVFPRSHARVNRVAGALAPAESSAVASIKVIARRSENGTIIAKAVALDSLSNIIQLPDSAWRLDNSRQTEPITTRGTEPMRGLDAAVLVERSLCSKDYNFASSEIAEFLSILNNQDRALVAEFNQTPKSKIDLVDASAAKYASESLTFDPASGLSAPNRAAVGALNILKSRANGSKPVLILISFCPDNGSLIFMPEDVVRKAEEMGASVYAIAFDESATDPCLLDITRRTGGAFYSLETADSASLDGVLKEIYLIEKLASEIEFKSEENEVSLAVMDGVGNRKKQALPVHMEERLIARPQILALFDHESVAIPSEYDPSFRSLADVLIDNPSKIIEISGSCGAEMLGSDSRSYLAIERAQSVKQKLITMGVSPTQLRVSDYRFQSPEAPPLSDRDWQAALARRAEFRWIDPSLLPYELVESLYDSEEQAAARAQFYQKQGLRAYYAPMVRGENPAYGVKLWGFATLEEATAAAKNLKSRFKKDFTVK